MPEKSIYTRIIDGEVMEPIIYEDDKVIVILSAQPICEGHTLVIPKKHTEHIWDIDDEDYKYLWQIAKKFALRLRIVMNVDRVGMVIKGFSVSHTHIHLIPVNHNSRVNFDPRPKPQTIDTNTLSHIADRIRF